MPFPVSQTHDVLASCSNPVRKASLRELGGGPEKGAWKCYLLSSSSHAASTTDPLSFPKKPSQAFPQTQTAIREILLPDGLFFP